MLSYRHDVCDSHDIAPVRAARHPDRAAVRSIRCRQVHAGVHAEIHPIAAPEQAVGPLQQESSVSELPRAHEPIFDCHLLLA